MNIKMICTLGILAGTLAACSSTSSSTSSQFDDALALVEAFGIEGVNVDEISSDDLPDSADMSGVMIVELSDSDTGVFGDATLAADFGAGTLSGSASNFGEYEFSEACDIGIEGCTGTMLQSIDGSLDIAGNITGIGFTYNTAGTLMGEDLENDESVTADLDMDGSGYFGAVDGNLVALGTGDGNAVLSSESGSDEVGASNVLLVSE